MEFKRILYPYYQTFYYLGMCPRTDELNPTKLNGCRKIFQHLPLCAFVLFIVLTTIIGVKGHINTFRSIHTLHQVMKHMFFPTETLCAVILIGQCALGKAYISKIIKGLIVIDRIIIKELKTIPNYRRLKWRLFWCTFTPVFVYILSMLSMLIAYAGLYLRTGTYTYSLSLYLLQYPVVMSSVHIIIYTELVRFYLETLNHYLKLNMKASILNTSLLLGYRYFEKLKLKFAREQMKTFKRIHICLWMVMEHINDFFGWSVAVVLFSSILDVIYDVHWIYLCQQNVEKCNNRMDYGGSYNRMEYK